MAGSLTLMRGYPGSGKSTLTKQMLTANNRAVRVSRDSIRMEVFGSSTKILDPSSERVVTTVQKQMVDVLLRAGREVIIDDTNLRTRFAREWADVAVSHQATFQVIDVTTSLEECLRRNDERDVPEWVDPDVIKKMAQKWPIDKWLPITPKHTTKAPVVSYVQPEGDVSALILCDVDGTVANFDGLRGPFDWSKVGGDKPYDHVLDMVITTYEGWGTNTELVFMSGRDGVSYDDTYSWLQFNLSKYSGYDLPFQLYMRTAGDTRSDDVVKSELFDKHIRPKGSKIVAVFDDRPKVLRLWNALGLPLFAVNKGTEGVEF